MNEELLPAVPDRFSSAVSTPIGSEPQDIVRFAMERGATVEVIERMMIVRRELRAEKAKEAFDDAMAAFQAECPIIEKTKAVMVKGALRYRYAPLDSIVGQIKHLLDKHGFSYKINSEVEDGWVKAICLVTHRGGHQHPSEFKVPVEKDAFMSGPQKYASSLTFASRYAFRDAFGILTTDEDTDAQAQLPDRGFNAAQAERAAPAASAATHAPAPAPAKPPETSAAKKRLWEACKEIRGAEKSWDVAIAWMSYKKILNEGAKISDLTDEEMTVAADRVEIELQN